MRGHGAGVVDLIEFEHDLAPVEKRGDPVGTDARGADIYLDPFDGNVPIVG